MKKKVSIVEMSLRDGLQNEKQNLDLEQRTKIFKGLISAGLRRIEVGAFVSPQWVPQMALTSEFVQHLASSGLMSDECSVLVPNERGMIDAMSFPVREVAVFTAASETFAKKNINCSIDQSLERFHEVFRIAKARKIKVRAYVSTAFYCPYEGRIEPKEVLRVAKALIKMGAYEVSIGDTIGAAVPTEVEKLFKLLKKSIPVGKLAGHFHDTRGTALANIYAAYRLGISTFDSSAGGLGGCPYAPGAGGNVATEDVAYFFESMGVKTNVDIETLIKLKSYLQDMVQHPLSARLTSLPRK